MIPAWLLSAGVGLGVAVTAYYYKRREDEKYEARKAASTPQEAGAQIQTNMPPVIIVTSEKPANVPLGARVMWAPSGVGWVPLGFTASSDQAVLRDQGFGSFRAVALGRVELTQQVLTPSGNIMDVVQVVVK